MQMENHQKYMCLTLSSPRKEGEVTTPITDQQTYCNQIKRLPLVLNPFPPFFSAFLWLHIFGRGGGSFHFLKIKSFAIKQVSFIDLYIYPPPHSIWVYEDTTAFSSGKQKNKSPFFNLKIFYGQYDLDFGW